jgi:hypothetical protein
MAMPEAVFMEHGATTIPADRNEPDEIVAAMSPGR